MSLPPLECKFITDDSLQQWRDGNANFKVLEPVPILRFIYELCWNIVHGELPIAKCRMALDSVEYVEESGSEEIGSVFADVCAQMATDFTMSVEYRSRLIKLTKWLVEAALVPVRLFQERNEEEFLWESEMTKIRAQDLKNKAVRVNTRLLYQQTKFNLLREESEGYAKLVTLLCQCGTEAIADNLSGATTSIIKSLIGHFDLDPNRVFDIVLECFEHQFDNNVFIDLIPIFPKSHASQILGFKFQYYQRLEVLDSVPVGLYKLTAVLVKAGFINLDSICAHLLPKDEDAFNHYDEFSSKRFDEALKIGKINLAATGKDLMEDDKQGEVTYDLYTALDMESEAVAERSQELENNQILGLLNGFLSVDDWFHAHLLFDRLSPLNPVAHVQICNGLFRVIEKTISSISCNVHQTNSLMSSQQAFDVADRNNTRSLSQRSFVDLPKELFQMLSSAGPYLYRNAVLLQKVCRLVKGYFLSAQELVASGGKMSIHDSYGPRDPRLHLKEARLRVEEALGTCFLPSLQLIPANPAVGQVIWELMTLLPYESRYRLYGEWEKDDEKIPMLLAARQTAKLDTRRILKRLAKENLKQLGRMVAKLAHANPMTVLRTIVNQIEAYRDMINPVVDAFKYLTQLEYDILEYVVIERLVQGGREKLKDDGINLSDWLQSLASFWGHLCKKYPSMELRGLFQYLVNQLKKGNGIELVLLQELIQQMANVQYTENMTEDQLDAMAGSETLRYQATSFGMTKNNKALIKSSNRLRDSLLPKEEPKLALPLLLLIAQHRSVVLINSDVPYIKMVSEQFDRCHGTLLQYVDFLCSAITPTKSYAQLIPPLDELFHKYHLDSEVAFLIYRPVMRLFQSSSSSNVFWPFDCTEDSDKSNGEESELSVLSFKMVLELGSSRKTTMWSDLLGTVRTMLPSKAWNSLSPDLYATFWGLTLYDLYVPRNRYQLEISKQHAALKALEELSDNSSSAITKRKKDKERIQELLDRLTSELKKHEENVSSVNRRLSREKDRWLSSCPDTLKINMEFLQRCIFPRCILSMPDAVYCAKFVHTLHSLGTPFFNTVNHIDVLICKTLHPMICCCTEYEAGRLGRFLFETLKMAYHWKSGESVYARECGNMPGFAVYYRYPNSQRVEYGQFIRVHWKWSGRITRLLIQCLESAEYMEIRNALLVLTKISSVFPVTRKSGLNIEKRVIKIKGDEREDLKVLATGVAAALASRKNSWVTEEEFGMGIVDLKPAPSSSTKSLSITAPNGSVLIQIDPSGTRNIPSIALISDSVARVKDPKTKPVNGKPECAESIPHTTKLKSSPLSNGLDMQSTMHTDALPSGVSKTTEKHLEESKKDPSDDNAAKLAPRIAESELRPPIRRTMPARSLAKQPTAEVGKDESKPTKSVNGNAMTASSKGSTASAKKFMDIHGNQEKAESGAVKQSEVRTSVGKVVEDALVSERPFHRSAHSPLHDDSLTASKTTDKQQKRSNPVVEHKSSKRRKGENEAKDWEVESQSDRERSLEKSGLEEQSLRRAAEKAFERSKEKGNERNERDQRERLERPDKSAGDDIFGEKSRARSIERYRERSVDRVHERVNEKKDERNKDDRGKSRYNDSSFENSHNDERPHRQSLPPPPPLPPNMVPQSLTASRKDDDVERRVSSTRQLQRLSPKHEEKKHRRSEENLLVSQDDAGRRKERDDRDGISVKTEERDKGSLLKDDLDAAAVSKKRKLKRDILTSAEAGEYVVGVSPPHSHTLGSSLYDGRERGERKGNIVQRMGYLEDPGLRMHSKEAVSKATHRDSDPAYEREWADEKRLRPDPKRKHRK